MNAQPLHWLTPVYIVGSVLVWLYFGIAAALDILINTGADIGPLAVIRSSTQSAGLLASFAPLASTQVVSLLARRVLRRQNAHTQG